jgi:hypothetical protein
MEIRMVILNDELNIKLIVLLSKLLIQSMGFHIYITCIMEICKDTGRHFYYGDFKKIYSLPPVVPEEYRKYVKMNGGLFKIYTSFVTDELDTSVENFVDKYPEWSDIVETSDFEEYCDFWNEDMHDEFYDALKWFSDHKSCYMISWTE